MPRPRSAALALTVVALPALCGWTRPQLPSTPAKPVAARGAQLDYVIVAVNGEARMVKAGEELAVVRGDLVELRDGALLDRKAAPKELNLVGFQASRRTSDDRGTRLDTAKDLSVKWSEGGRGDLFAILATTRADLHGAVYLRLIDPVLRYAELSVNGRPLVLRGGEPVTVGAKDKVKVERVVTNLQSDEGVYFQIVPLDGEDYEIRFLRGERAFAAIPLKVKD